VWVLVGPSASVADRIGEADAVRAGVERASEQLFEVVEVSSGAVLADDLDPEAVIFGVVDQLLRRRDVVLVRRADLVLDVSRARGDDEVDAVDATVERQVDVLLDAAAERRHRRVEVERRHLPDGLALAGAGAGAPGLDVLHFRPVERAGDVGLLVGRERDAWRLLAVAQGRVEQLYCRAGDEGAVATLEEVVVCQNGVLSVSLAGEFHSQPPCGDFLYPPSGCVPTLYSKGVTPTT
jgi:hypothetical protein